MAAKKPERFIAFGINDDATEDSIDIIRKWNIETHNEPHDALSLMNEWPDFRPGYIDRPTVLKVTDIHFENIGTSPIIEATVTWSKIDSEDPLQMAIQWSAASSVIEVPAYVDLDKKPIVTTAGEPIEGATRKLKCWQFSGVRNVASVPMWLALYGESCNLDDFRIDGFPVKKGQMFLSSVQIGKQQEVRYRQGSRKYRELNIEMTWRRDGWNDFFLNAGFYEIQTEKYPGASPGEFIEVDRRVRCHEDDGEPTAEKVLLDKNGRRLRSEDGRRIIKPKPKDIVTLEFRLNELLPFGPLIR